MQAKIEQLRIAIEESELRAPFDGVVSAVNFEPGMMAHPGDTVARIVGGQGLRARIAVPEESGSLLRATRARLTYDDQTLVATVTHVTSEPEPASRAFVIEADIPALTSSCGVGATGCAALSGRAVRASLEAP
jgi:multidrug efflux pump subunit AcrA (membrane-fusion protein)